MKLILISIVVLIIIGVLIVKHFEEIDSVATTCIFALGVFFVMSCCIGLIVFMLSVNSWIAADYKAKIINRAYGTNYTQDEIFYADDVINKIQQNRTEISCDVQKNTKK